MAIIRTLNLTKKFGELVAVDRLDLEIAEGECFGLLGPNGAGKTSLIRMITAVSPPARGEIWVNGKNLKDYPRQAKALMGVVSQVDNLDTDLNVLQNLTTFARYFSIPRDEAYRRSRDVLRLFQLEDRQKSRIKELSGGMKRRLLIARSLINHPRILILDEPSIGLDPQARHLVWQKLRELKTEGITQLLCTQNVEEATLLCDRVAIIHLGRVLAIDTPQALISRYAGNKVWELEITSADSKGAIIRELTRRHLEFEEVGSIIQVFHADDDLSGILPTRWRSATLEDIFFRLTGRALIE